jgi:hypothetical protein
MRNAIIILCLSLSLNTLAQEITSPTTDEKNRLGVIIGGAVVEAIVGEIIHRTADSMAKPNATPSPTPRPTPPSSGGSNVDPHHGDDPAPEPHPGSWSSARL